MVVLWPLTMGHVPWAMGHIILLCSNLTQPGPSGSFDQVEAAAPHACGPTDEPLAAAAAVAAVAPSLPDEAWFVNVTYLQTPDCKT